MKKVSMRLVLDQLPERRLEKQVMRTLDIVKSRLQLMLGLAAAIIIVVTSWQTLDFQQIEQKMTLLKTLLK